MFDYYYGCIYFPPYDIFVPVIISLVRFYFWTIPMCGLQNGACLLASPGYLHENVVYAN